ncbi:unnamed protein product [Acanthocheilonema viteae]|uniref:RNase NYN domain-containing protein n=1 Tax=Acanthocheilonema viteae TaxID=6277 RepID=A0A498S736_ACAVI|nr:unnamed protein product [Acanthocheilonema viteae]
MYPFDRIRERIYARPSESAVPRLIVIDGCNVARSSCGTDPRTARAGRPAFINYDDLYVLEFAERHGGCVLSSDRFDDIAKEHSYKDLRRIIEERRINVIFRPLTSDFVHYGRDRFFRFLPEICIIHDNNDFWQIEEHIQQRLYCLPDDKDYVKAVSRRQRWTVERRDEIVCTIDALFDEIAAKNCLVPKIIPIQFSNTKVSRNTATLSTTSTKLTVTRSTRIAYDARCAKIINRLDQIFDRALIVKLWKKGSYRFDMKEFTKLINKITLNWPRRQEAREKEENE